jgi:phage terminase small subunit
MKKVRLEVAMASKSETDKSGAYADSESAPKGKAAAKSGSSSRVAKVNTGKGATKASGKAPAKARNSAAPGAAKTVEKPASETPAKQGTTAIKNPIELTPKQLEALALATLHGLSPKMAKFVDLYLATYNASWSYREAGYTAKNDNVAAAGASKLLKKVKAHPYYAARQAEMFQRTADVQNQTIGVIHAAAFADQREISELRRACCRYCYGIEHRYQHTPREMEHRREEYAAELAAAQHDGKGGAFPPFDELGGLGYDKREPPNPQCPECAGEGYQYTYFHDSRGYSPAAVALFEGVEETKDGLKIRAGSQKGYRELLAKIFDLHVEPAVVVQTGPSTEELDARIERAQAETLRKREEMQERLRRIEQGEFD